MKKISFLTVVNLRFPKKNKKVVWSLCTLFSETASFFRITTISEKEILQRSFSLKFQYL